MPEAPGGRSRWPRILTITIAVGVVLFAALPPLVDRLANRVVGGDLPPVSSRAAEIYRRLLVADLHADSLLWQRSIDERSGHGHVDVPRLIEGGVDLQVFTIVTKVPWGLNIESNSARGDIIAPLVVAQRWPPRTWTSLVERALHQAQKLARAADRSNGRLVWIRNREELDRHVARHDRSPATVAAILGIEGAHALEGDLANLERLFAAGVRMIGLTHFFDNELGGSAHGITKGGLSDLGRRTIARLEELGITVDLAHASAALIDDALAVTTAPVVVSHTGVKGTCDNTRNLADRHLRAIAATGGVVGIGYWETAVCGREAAAVARAIRYAVDLVGAEHVALGSDFDGAIAAPFDTTGLPSIVDALLAEGFDEDAIAKVMGANAVRVLRANLPESNAAASVSP